ncbi:MAG: patatin-like phospholipase family protein [Proteobacteria bacterium]|nr:patatin-like phospholipase family protein [Pseudomonadota bacterium]MBU1450636.1 patatin-like phospholipase family protein [Pseudomonadota bacterium]MBU2467093.1 patatin-like phospholipase family protein [Pseudomonadota bacterium]MBU2518717.1 patatin-like phospholipase family protein [Pseudomonadota bacterium]
MNNPSTGFVLALGGGGARGFAHVGIFQVLQARGLPVKGVVGTSAGALAGAGFALGYTSDQMRQRVIEFAHSPLASHPRLKAMRGGGAEACLGLTDRVTRLFCQGLLVKSFLLDDSLLGTDFFHEMVSFFLPPVRLEDALIPFAAVATDVKTGQMVVLDRGDLRRAVHASCAVPGVVAPVEINGRYLMDGGATCLVPTPVARGLASGPVLAVNVDRDIGAKNLPGQSLEYYMRATEIQGYHLAQMLCDLADMVLRPALGDVHWADFSRAAWIMDQGAKAAEDAWKQMEALIRPAGPWWRRALRGGMGSSS